MPDNLSPTILLRLSDLTRASLNFHRLRLAHHDATRENEQLKARIAELEAENARLVDGLKQVEFANRLVVEAAEKMAAQLGEAMKPTVIRFDLEKLPAALKELRRQSGLTQGEIATQLGIATITLSRYENGSRRPPLSVVVKLAAVYGYSISFQLVNDKQGQGEQ